MAGGTYNVVQAESCPSNKRDTSFRSCVCALLVVLCICLIGLLVSVFLRGSRKEKKDDDNYIFGNENQNQDLTTKFITKLTKQPTLSFTTEVTTKSKSTASTKPTDYTIEKVSKYTINPTTSILNGQSTSTNLDKKETIAEITNTESIAAVDKNAMATDATPISVLRNTTTIQEEFASESTTLYINAQNTVTGRSITSLQNVPNNTVVTESSEGTTTMKTTIQTNSPVTINTTDKLVLAVNTTLITNQQQTSETTAHISYTTNMQSTSATFLNNIQTTTELNFPQNLSSIVFSNANEVCETASCKSAAVDILTPMNHSVDPCDDFYEFACGRFAKKKSENNEEFLLHMNRMSNTSFDYLKVVKIFFESCVSHESEFLSSKTIQQARRLVDNVGELIIDNTKSVGAQELSALLAKLILRQSVPFFDVNLDVRTVNGSSSYVLQLTLPQHSVSEWSSLSESRRRCLRLQSGKTYGENLNLTEIYESFLECQKNYSVYLDSMENVVRTLGMLENVKNDSQLLGIIKEIRFTVEDIFKILEILPSQYEVRRSLINQDKVTMGVSDLTQKFSQLDWTAFLKTIVPTQSTSNAIIEVFMFDYFTKAFQELHALGYKKVYNALLAIYTQDVYSNVVFEPVTSDREEFCVGRAFDLFPDIVNYIYKTNAKKFDVERNITELIFNKLKAQLASSLDSASNWMDNDVIIKFKTKINQATLRFNENSDFSSAELENRYQNFSMQEDDYVNNIERAMIKRRRNLYSFWGENLRQEHIFQLFTKPTADQPLFLGKENTFYIPDGMLKSIHEDWPFYLSMSSVGWRLAKVLATAFDPINVKSIIPKSSTFNNLVESTREQLKHVNEINFNGYSVTLNWNGSLSVNKRVVDNAAFRLLLDASQPDDSFNEIPLPLISMYYSREKIIFISAIQEFCEEMSLLNYMERIYESENLPAPLMADNVLINSQNFATTFECKPGSSMNIFDVRYQFPYLEKVEDYNNYEYEISN